MYQYILHFKDRVEVMFREGFLTLNEVIIDLLPRLTFHEKNSIAILENAINRGLEEVIAYRVDNPMQLKYRTRLIDQLSSEQRKRSLRMLLRGGIKKIPIYTGTDLELAFRVGELKWADIFLSVGEGERKMFLLTFATQAIDKKGSEKEASVFVRLDERDDKAWDYEIVESGPANLQELCNLVREWLQKTFSDIPGIEDVEVVPCPEMLKALA